MITFLSWLAVAVLAVSYWCQIAKTHIHKEVRDISLWYHIGLAFGFGMLIFTAYLMPDSPGKTVFFWKQILTFAPVVIIIWQILYHRRDHWHDDSDPYCNECHEELEPEWMSCPYCGTPKIKIIQ